MYPALVSFGVPALVCGLFTWLGMDLPGHAPPLIALSAGIYGFLFWVYLRSRPLRDPPLEATVTGRVTGERTVIHVVVRTPEGLREAVLADEIAGEHLHRFQPDTTWSVHTVDDRPTEVHLDRVHREVRG
ncbi:hypothetical protein BLA60_34710 [Actinophytocola xinjiangensis]|uniref:Uncharacterized protein n=1 Tax=Actinophytocola xinjiangensis TaxID=485602 RepID=A0A7Z1AU68_9PSEU|nr:hypothetical protein [Actinophytocola xinjiangensis]OLF05671.1 hypothetical protein BLA60_34710 [Actinophytocola xinjiangensis]